MFRTREYEQPVRGRSYGLFDDEDIEGSLTDLPLFERQPAYEIDMIGVIVKPDRRRMIVQGRRGVGAGLTSRAQSDIVMMQYQVLFKEALTRAAEMWKKANEIPAYKVVDEAEELDPTQGGSFECLFCKCRYDNQRAAVRVTSLRGEYMPYGDVCGECYLRFMRVVDAIETHDFENSIMRYWEETR